jgi:hypothetical protein
MPAVEFLCPHCGAELAISDSEVGKPLDCARCFGLMIVPGDDAKRGRSAVGLVIGGAFCLASVVGAVSAAMRAKEALGVMHVGDVEEQFIGLALLLLAVMIGLVFLWVLVTGVGLILMRDWARISALVMGACTLVVTGGTGLFIIGMALLGKFTMAHSDEEVIRASTNGAYLLLAAAATLAIMIVLTRRKVKIPFGRYPAARRA